HADHEINCSAFSARVTTSSLSDLHSAIVSAIGTLKGPLHGGANEAVIKMLQEIGTLNKAPAFIENALSGKQKVMGIGHRVYKNGDPRAAILRKISERVTREAGIEDYYKMSVLIDETMLNKKGLMPNVDFYSATVYYSMGIPTDIFTPIFAVSRIGGWCAHVQEQYSKNRIYRPRGQYTGPTAKVWKPLGSR
ncbi:MAG: citrate/2-methylcitrate synthase, partial [Bdellovibrionota bacterium]